jgi:hypothetical protein
MADISLLDGGLRCKRRMVATLLVCASFGMISACSSAVADDGSQSAMGRKTKITPPGKSTDTATGGGTVTTATNFVYDDSVGLSVTNGFADLSLRVGARRFFVNSASGSDGNGCTGAQSASKPLKTLAAGVACVADGSGDQLLLAEGTRYAETLPWLSQKNGYSPQYPTVIQSYDPADPANEAKYGRGDQRGARPVIVPVQTVVSGGTGPHYLAIRGLDFNPGNLPDIDLIFRGKTDYILIENNIFRFTSLSFDNGDQALYAHVVVRGNSFYGQWSTSGRTGGFYISGANYPTVEDNVFWHNGWRIGGSRDDAITAGGATVFSHPFYLQTYTYGAILRRNLSMDGAGDGGIARGDITATENISIDNPICLGLGGGPNYNTERPNGVNIQASYNACLGTADVNSSHPLGWGINTANGISGSSVHHNLLVMSRTGGAIQAYSNYAAFDQPSYADYHDNLSYAWIVPGVGSTISPGTAFPAKTFSTFNTNTWDDAAQGTNKNNGGMSFSKAYDDAALFAALGCSDKATCAARMIETPELGWGAKARALLFAGYGL